jgi:hypothetical protein
MNDKSSLIQEHEELFARALSLKVINKPKLSIWMILIPVIFVHYFYQFQKFTAGRKMFVENYLISRKHALDEAVAVADTGKEPEIERLAKLSNLPAGIREQLSEVLAVLVEHYIILLRANGRDFESLVRSAYRNQMNYLLFINRLNNTEKLLYTALMPHLNETNDNINDIVSAIEFHSIKLRKESADRIFS